MQIPIYHVDAFTDKLYSGNPAAVCVLQQWLSDEVMQSIAFENNLSETAFIMPKTEAEYAIRWFAISKEIPLCGHATLAAAFVAFTYLQPELSQVSFQSQSGNLSVQREQDKLWLNFPLIYPEPIAIPEPFANDSIFKPQAAYQARNLLLVFDHEQQVRDFVPHYANWQPFNWHGLIITAPSFQYDFVSRFFVQEPAGEDPVTGSAHCMLTPYWVKRLNKSSLHAKQLSSRGGEIWCELQGERVLLKGKVVPYLSGTIDLA